MRSHSLSELNATSTAGFADTLGDIFEHTPWVAQTVADRRPFATVTDLHQAMIEVVVGLPEDRLLGFLNRHPELAGPSARTKALTEASKLEQAGAGLDELTPEETAALAESNTRYRRKFGFPFIICALRHSQDAIFAELRQRLDNSVDEERHAALAEIARISALRLVRRLGDEEMPQVHGAMTTHLLDTAQGKPAAGVPIELHLRLETGKSRLIAQAISNRDGRTDEPLIHHRPVPNGTYELRFALGEYFAASATASFYDVVPVRFTTSEPEAHYHIPLLFSPWSYTTYRGS